MHARLKEQVAKLEILLNATGGIPSPDGGGAPKPKTTPNPAAKLRPHKARRAKRKKATARRAKPQPQREAPAIPAVDPARAIGAKVADALSETAKEKQPSDVIVSADPPETSAETWTSRHKAGTWTACIRDIVCPTDRPLPYEEIKEALLHTDVADLLRRSDKAFYGALGKLEAEGIIYRYKGHAFSPTGYRKFKEDLAAGRVRDLKYHNPAHNSPMGDAITAMMKSRQSDAESGHIRWFLKKDPIFAEQLDKNPTHLYNVLSRLVAQGVLRKGGKSYQYVATKNEAPSGLKPEGAPSNPGEPGRSSGVG
jgi:hypothetical protein